MFQKVVVTDCFVNATSVCCARCFSQVVRAEQLRDERMRNLFPRCDMSSWYCGLCGEEASSPELVSEALVSPVPARAIGSHKATFLDVDDTISRDQQFVQFFPFLHLYFLRCM